MNNNLKDAFTVITGASNGIGKALAIEYAKLNSNLIIIARDYKKLQKLKQDLLKIYKVKVYIFKIDISDESSIQKLSKSLKLKKIKLDFVLNCAAIIGVGGKIHKIKSNKWDYTIKVNLYGTFYLMKYLIPIMRKNSLFIGFSGGGGTNPQPTLDSYASSKAAVIRLLENVSLSYLKEKICFTAISPGGINTRIFQDLKKIGKKNLAPKLWKEIVNREKYGGDDINSPINLILYLSQIKDRSAFNGRVISAKYDDWSYIYKKRNLIKNKDIFKLRRVDLTNSKYTI